MMMIIILTNKYIWGGGKKEIIIKFHIKETSKYKFEWKKINCFFVFSPSKLKYKFSKLGKPIYLLFLQNLYRKTNLNKLKYKETWKKFKIKITK